MPFDDIRNTKIKKLEALRALGVDPYPAVSDRTHSIAQALASFDSLACEKEEVVLAGRIMARREHGGSIFVDLNDGSTSLTTSGNKFQGLLKEDVLSKADFELFQELIDIGDFIEIKGILFTTKRGEKTIEAKSIKLLTKALQPLPEKWHGLVDEEERLRKRYLDIVMDPSQKEMFEQKSHFWQATRDFLLKEGGLEVETPILEQVPGGADADPFETHMNALDIDLYLRISPELSLKKLNVAGFDKIFEIGRIFRNEGIDREHLQDYTQMEMYWAYTDYEKLMEIVERLIKYTIQETIGTLQHAYKGSMIDWSQNWPKVDYYEVFEKYTNIDLSKATEEDLKSYARKENIDVEKHLGRGRLIDIIFKKKCRPHLLEPSFLILPPVDIEPLAKRWPKDTERVERFQIVACGSELGKGFSELNDPIDQRQRFEEQSKMREAGDTEAQFMNTDFVEALEHGMPPTAGFAYSERLFSFIVDKPIRETVFFPIMKSR